MITIFSQTQHVILFMIYSNMFRLTKVIIRLSLNHIVIVIVIIYLSSKFLAFSFLFKKITIS